MIALSPLTTNELRALLLDCEVCRSEEALRTFFKDPRLSLWKNGLLESRTIGNRVSTVISYLLNHHNIEGQNALALFLYALAQAEPEQEKAQQFADLAERVRYASIEGRIAEYSKKLDDYDALEQAGKPVSNYITQQRLELRESIQTLQAEMTQRGFPPLGESAS